MADVIISCPVCSEVTDLPECPSCQASLSPLHEVQRTAYERASKVVELARGNKIKDAADQAATGARLYLDSDLRDLFGWVLFLDGRLESAARVWKRVPEAARSIVETYNEALGFAQKERWGEAFETLERRELPFRPAVCLHLVCAVRVGADARARELADSLKASFPDISNVPYLAPLAGSERTPSGEKPPWSKTDALSLPVGLVATTLLAGGVGLGFLMWGPGGDVVREASGGDSPVAGSDTVVEPNPSIPTQSGPQVPDSLKFGWAYVQDQPRTIAAAVDETVGPEPLAGVHRVPERTRRQSSRRWYLEGREAVQDGRREEAVGLLKASLASVGSGAELYWVDDALYLLVSTLDTRAPKSAIAWAQELVALHDTSMFANSKMRSIARGEIGGSNDEP